MKQELAIYLNLLIYQELDKGMATPTGKTSNPFWKWLLK